MLSRLMKYEMRSQSRLLLPLHALLLLASILGRFFITGKVYERVPTVVFIILITPTLFSTCGLSSTGTQIKSLSGSIRVCLVMKDTWLLPCR